MVREGAFDDLDALLFWHPSSITAVIGRSGLALDSIRPSFAGARRTRPTRRRKAGTPWPPPTTSRVGPNRAGLGSRS
jgi:hypothetical protein